MKEVHAFLRATPQQRMVAREHLTRILTVLRAQYLLFQTLHWKFADGYQDHLLFQRLYEDVTGEVDSLAEKIIGLLGPDSFSLQEQLSGMGFWVRQWEATGGDSKETALRATESLLSLLEEADVKLKAASAMTVGLNDWLGATGSTHETHAYLLQQALGRAPSE